MKIKHYQYIHSLDSGATLYEEYLISYFNINTNQTYKEVIIDLQEAMAIKMEEYNGKQIKVGDKIYMAEKDFYDCTYEQFVRLDALLAEDKNIENLHKLIAIYCRPRVFNPLKLRWQIEPFILSKQDKIAEHLKEHMSMDDAHNIMIFFSDVVKGSMKNIGIYYLNQKKRLVQN